MKKNEKEIEISSKKFDRNINLFLPENKCLIPSDYQFLSYFDLDLDSIIDQYAKSDSKDKIGNKQATDFTNYLNRIDKSGKDDASSFDARVFFTSFFHSITEYAETEFNKFLFNLFKIICPDSLLKLNENNCSNHLKKYEEKFIDQKEKEKFNKKALYFWLSLGFKQSDYYPSLTAKEFTKFDIEEVSFLHNLCFFFSCKLIFVYFDRKERSRPKFMPVGCINSENVVFIGLRYDVIKGKLMYHLSLPKPKSVQLEEKFIKYILSEKSEEFCIPLNKEEEIYDINIAQSCLLENSDVRSEGNLFDQIFLRNFIAANVVKSRSEVNMFKFKGKVNTDNFIFPIFDSEKNDATLFSITANSNVEIIDMCFNDTSVYIISKYTNKEDKKTYVKIFEGSIGDQFLDDMYLCKEIKIDSENVYGKVSLLKGKRISTPIALIIYKNKDEKYELLIYTKPQSKPLPNQEISNNYFYPSSLQYYTTWKLYKDKKPEAFSIKKEDKFDSIGFDGDSIIFLKDKKNFREIDLDDYPSSIGDSYNNIESNDDDDDKDKGKDENKGKDKEKKLDLNEISDILRIDEKIYYLIGIEISNFFFLLLDKKENIYYHPARNNFYLKSAIKSAFYKYKEKMGEINLNLNKDGPMAFGIIEALIDIGYRDRPINGVFHSNPIIPGIYLTVKNEDGPVEFEEPENDKKGNDDDDGKEDEDDRPRRPRNRKKAGKKRNGKRRRGHDDEDEEEDDDESTGLVNVKPKEEKNTNKQTTDANGKDKILYTLSVAFGNAGMIVGKDVHRTKCQLVAAYATSTSFTVYGPSKKITKYEPIHEVYDNWTLEKGQEMLANLVATYSVLLEIKSDVEFNIAMNTLKTTKGIRDEFDKFYNDFKKNWNII